MMKKLLTALLASSLLLTACTGGGGKETAKKDIDLSSYPIETDVTLTYFRALSASISTLVENYAETDFAKELSKRTGVNVEYLHPSAGNTSESINLMIASNELPDIIENNWVTGYPGGAVKAMNERVIVDIGQYKEYAPALFKIFADNPEYDKSSKTDEGKYYGFPLIMGSPRLCISNGPAVRMDWVRELGLEAPETIEDWEIMLTAFKEKKGAVAPLSLNSGGISQLIAMLGAKNGAYIKDGKVVYGPTQPEYKEALTIASDWFKKGLLDNNVASVDSKMLSSQILTGKTGAALVAGGSGIGTYMPSGVLEDPDFDLCGVKFPVKNKGEVNSFAAVSHAITGNGTAAITSQCKYPELAAKFLDYLYTDEGYMFGNFGIEGKTYEMKDGVPTYTELITKNPDGLKMNQALGMNVRAGTGTAFSCDPGYIDQYYALPQQQAALDAWVLSVEEGRKMTLPTVMPTSEESEEYANIMAEVEKHKEQMLIKFIMGIEPMDKFDDFVKDLKKLNVERAMEIQTAALKRYNKR
ncbi:MAG: extracellular solute-binding protein [Clostridia bacterium]|nr:extracellular solute-binding protein [Clostridia bacterium]